MVTEPKEYEPTKAQKLRATKVVDSREPEIIRSKLLELGWQQWQLYSGDFMFYTHDIKKVLVTRKTVQDLLSSIFNKGKRFAVDLEEMLNHSDLKVILIEGSWKTVTPDNNLLTARGVEYYTWDTVWDYLQSWMDRGFSLQLTINEGHTLKRINKLYAYYQQSYHTGGHNLSGVGDDRILAFPKGCRGNTAETILEHFGSLKNAVNSNEQDYLTIDGVGKKKAESIVKHFNRSNSDEQH